MNRSGYGGNMASEYWPTRPVAVTNLFLDARNPRLGRETGERAPREILQYLFTHDKALEVASSIATRGYFPNEPLLAVKESNRLVVVEGNRRLAALKALLVPELLEGSLRKQLERLARKVVNPELLKRVPVTVAPDRRSTDRQIAGRHVGAPVLAWQAENRASFILDKIEEGYENEELADELGFTLADIQKARQTRAIADMARSVDLPDEVKAKLDNPRAKVFTTIGRVFESTVGRSYLKVEPDSNHGIKGTTTRPQFLKVFTRLVTDVALGKESSRSLNTNEDIAKYFRKLPSSDLPKKSGSFVPADIIKGRSVASSHAVSTKPSRQGKAKGISKTVIPKSFKVRQGKNERLVEIRDELTKLDRSRFPNAGAVLLRVFLELAVIDYLDRTGALAKLTAQLREKNKLRQGLPVLRDLRVEITKVAKARLPEADAVRVEKALKHDAAAPFSLDDLHSFVHQAKDFPGDRDIQQFWTRTEPLFRLMLEEPLADTK